MRNVEATIEALERKARDSAVLAPEREALFSKAEALRERYHVPQTQTAAPPKQPPPPRPPAPPTASFGCEWTWGSSTTTTINSNGVFTTIYVNTA